MNIQQILANCRRVEDAHMRATTPEQRRQKAIEVLHWTQAWAKAKKCYCHFGIREDGWINCTVTRL